MSGFISLGGGVIGGVGGNSNFATTLYTGNGATQNIVTGKNNAAASLTWIKRRDIAANHGLYDTIRGAQVALNSNNGNPNTSASTGLTVFNGNGFSVGSNSSVNASGSDYVAWTFLEAAGFFDIVTYAGTGSSISLPHNLGVEVGCIVVKRLDTAGDWIMYHRAMSVDDNLVLNSAAGRNVFSLTFGNHTPTDFVVRENRPDVSAVGGSHVAYLFAHNPSKKIACDGFTTNGSGAASVTLGFAPKWLLLKSKNVSQDWFIVDVERGWTLSPFLDALLRANQPDAEALSSVGGYPTSNGFEVTILPSTDYVYIAIG